jgi:hypothetical protein
MATINGTLNNDTLNGTSSNDTLDGGAGRDLMYGRAGSDTYRVDNVGDRVSEESTPGVDDGGSDTVSSSVSFSLGAFLEKLVLTGGGAIDGVGNALANNLKGNDAANRIFGGGAVDTLYGNGGDDVLIGGLGKDYYYGGAGADTFVLRKEGGTYDRIYDYEAADRLAIHAAAFGLVQGAGITNGLLSADYFVAATAATATGHGQFVYDAADEELLWDPDGRGSTNAFRVAVFNPGDVITADSIHAIGETVQASVSAAEAGAISESNSPVYFTFALSEALDEDAILTFRTVDGTAQAGQDFTGRNAVEVRIAAGATFAHIGVDLIADGVAERSESFTLQLYGARTADTNRTIAIGTGTATASITDGQGPPPPPSSDPRVVASHWTAPLGMTDPCGLTYDPGTGTGTGRFFMSDSEVDESPFSRPQNFFTVSLQGALIASTALPFTKEPTGLAMDSANDHVFIVDDDKYKMFCVDRDSLTTVEWQFDTKPVGGDDPEDIAFDRDSGHLFIVNGLSRTIVEVNQLGTTRYDTIALPSEISDPEALAYDAQNDLFYVGGGFSDKIWVVDRDGDIEDIITVLSGARAPGTNTRVHVKDIELAPASDGSNETHIYVADYGDSHVDDGRLIEIDMGTGWLVA